MNRTDAILRDPAFPRLKASVIGATGLAYYADKDNAFAERIGRRLAERSDLGLAGYLSTLTAEGPGGPEYQALIDELTVGETFFFRYSEQFEALSAVAIPECLRRNRLSRGLRIWSAGCSTGPEAYTLEILLKRHFAEQLQGWQVSIIGTDLNAGFIEQARRGVYGGWAVRGLPNSVLRECFDASGDRWSVKPRFREWTSFSVANLMDDPPANLHRGLGAMDIVLCRNVMIYFDEPARNRLLEGLHAALVPNGWLVVGHAETGPHVNALFSPVAVPGATIYRKPFPGVTSVMPARSEIVAPEEEPPATRREAKVPAPSPTPARKAARTLDPLPSTQLPLQEGGDRAEALERCLVLAERNRLDPAIHFQLGLLEEELGVGDPIAAFKRTLYLDAGFALADYHLALAYWRRGRPTPARRHFRNARASIAGLTDTDPVAQGGGLTVAELRSMIDLWFPGEEG